ncbi:hypothetical protein SAMN04488564_102172 [Lentzea waywayandensis]|uniref:Uncharacterized protein n=1 Tax=Lentzea waywayandensis TaxID=84724 RepID=A0A1I6DBL8_9PSEU|nr:hypothetical protein [Lentzea waywayandensis]SFR02761.1 hypothetical protein SAMN04488564_102172 [Lentzea waywayandensis]
MIHVDKSLSVLDGRHELHVLSLNRGDDSFALDYTITPPLPGDQPGGEMVFLWIEAADDQGHEYTDFGGARGTSDDGSHTTGTISGQPAIDIDAKELSVRFVFLRGQSEAGWSITIGLT